MSTQELTPDSGNPGQDALSVIESRLGQVLALIHRVLPRVDEPARSGEVQGALRKASALLEAARQAHEQGRLPAPAGT